MTKEDNEYLALLEEFLDKIIKLTLLHDVENDNAVVYVSNLDEALKTVDPTWYLRPSNNKKLD